MLLDQEQEDQHEQLDQEQRYQLNSKPGTESDLKNIFKNFSRRWPQEKISGMSGDRRGNLKCKVFWRTMEKKVCSQCPEPHLAKGLCRRHYNAAWYLADRTHQRELGNAWSARNRELLREYHADRRQSPDTRTMFWSKTPRVGSAGVG